MGCVAAGFLGVVLALIVIGLIALGYKKFFKSEGKQ
jgi:hypothetical protein